MRPRLTPWFSASIDFVVGQDKVVFTLALTKFVAASPSFGRWIEIKKQDTCDWEVVEWENTADKDKSAYPSINLPGTEPDVFKHIADFIGSGVITHDFFADGEAGTSCVCGIVGEWQGNQSRDMTVGGCHKRHHDITNLLLAIYEASKLDIPTFVKTATTQVFDIATRAFYEEVVNRFVPNVVSLHRGFGTPECRLRCIVLERAEAEENGSSDTFRVIGAEFEDFPRYKDDGEYGCIIGPWEVVIGE